MRTQAFLGAIFAALYLSLVSMSYAAPYAAFVVDARSGEVLHSRNADTRLHPASLTKMMTLYLAFQAVESGQINLNKVITISKNAASEPPSKLGLRAGQKIQFKYLIRAAAVKSANDAATALGEAIAGSESAFAKRMTATALQMGMKRTTFKNAHGLTRAGHLSTARDMTTLGRRLFYDFPGYYNLFSRISTDAGVKRVNNTNRRLLGAYKGADGIKTGYTNAAGYNLVASAERGNKRVIATVFGGRSTPARNARVAELLDMGFKRSPNRVATLKPKPLTVASLSTGSKSVRMTAPRAPSKSLHPKNRPAGLGVTLMAKVDQDAIENAVFAAVRDTGTQTEIIPPKAAPRPLGLASADPAAVVAAPAPQVARAATNEFVPTARPSSQETEAAILAALQVKPVPQEPVAPRIVERDTGNPRKWSVQLGAFRSRFQAEKLLLKTALADLRSLDGALRKIDRETVQGEKMYRARFVGLTQGDANKACARLLARAETCEPKGPGI